ncbi:hypothetical protein QE152_g34161 [Popillia japonica]|uniref:Uncharacterized protein n=1 Tax=Popillia japonica TaxID=7064 RepID=A0AAW1IUT2_POPJA
MMQTCLITKGMQTCWNVVNKILLGTYRITDNMDFNKQKLHLWENLRAKANPLELLGYNNNNLFEFLLHLWENLRAKANPLELLGYNNNNLFEFLWHQRCGVVVTMS